eukprot:SM004492S16474  [mRNA]  locus=s4492:31:286:- [translate_table: standard]
MPGIGRAAAPPRATVTGGASGEGSIGQWPRGAGRRGNGASGDVRGETVGFPL